MPRANCRGHRQIMAFSRWLPISLCSPALWALTTSLPTGGSENMRCAAEMQMVRALVGLKAGLIWVLRLISASRL